MHGVDIVAHFHAAMLTTLKLCTPLLVAPLIAGVLTAFIQAVTQISDSTLSFLPKLCATITAAYFAGPFLARTLGDYMQSCFALVILAGGQ